MAQALRTPVGKVLFSGQSASTAFSPDGYPIHRETVSSITIGEIEGELFNVFGPTDPLLKRFLQEGGVSYPLVAVPELDKKRLSDLHNGAANDDDIFLASSSLFPGETKGRKRSKKKVIFQDGSAVPSVASPAEQDEEEEYDEPESSSLSSSSSSSSNLFSMFPPAIKYALDGAAEAWQAVNKGKLAIEKAVITRFPSLRSLCSYTSLYTLFGPQRTLARPEDAVIAGMAWHPYRQRLCAALSDGTLRFYDVQKEEWDPISVLHSMHHKDITCIHWHPHNANTIAVACRDGVVLWNCAYPQAHSTAGRPSSAAAMADEQSFIHNVSFSASSSSSPLSALRSPPPPVCWSSSFSSSPFPQFNQYTAVNSNVLKPSHHLLSIDMENSASGSPFGLSSSASISSSSSNNSSSSALPHTPSISSLFKCTKQKPVSCMAWSPDGRYLAVGSRDDDSIYVWDTHFMQYTALTRKHAGGISILKWSPTGAYLFAAHTTVVFRIWETKTWTCESWSNFESTCQDAAWSANGQHLLVALTGDSKVYAYRLPAKPPKIGAKFDSAEPLAEAEVLEGVDTKRTIAGRIREMAWDPRSDRLVVSFVDSEAHSERIYQVVYETNFAEALTFTPLGFLESPIQCGAPFSSVFKPNFDSGALLAQAWQHPSGKAHITLVPFLFFSASHSLDDAVSDPSMAMGTGMKPDAYGQRF